MATYHNSLLARVFKARYFSKLDPFSANLGSRPSYAWRSIHCAQKLMRQGARVAIGNGQRTNVWQAQWVERKPARGIIKTNLDLSQNSAELVPEMKVAELMIAGTRECNRPLLQKLFPLDEVQRIEKIRPGGNQSEDVYEWEYTKTGLYSVKSGYWVQKNVLEENMLQVQVSQPSIDSLYQAIWKTKTSPKVQHFLWKCLSNSLPTGENMVYRHIAKEASCPRCDNGPESINHLLFQCSYARLIWALSPIKNPNGGVLAHSLYSNLHHVLRTPQDGTMDCEELELGPWVIWRLWKNRNGFVFIGKDYDGASTVQKAIDDAKEWRNKNEVKDSKVKVLSTNQAPLGWKSPRPQWIKCNVDGAWKHQDDEAGIGWISRDQEGRLIWAGARKIQGVGSAIEAEAEALRWAVSTLVNFGYKKVIMESDSQVLIQMIRGEEVIWPKLLPIIQDIIHTLKRVNEFEMIYHPRGGNKAADRIAKEALSYMNYVPKLYSMVPDWLKSVVEADKPCV